jgi:hypothetical protein
MPSHAGPARLRQLLLLGSMFAACAGAAPTRSNGPTSGLVGEWRGRSLCVTTTRPACTDETVLYRIRRDAPGKDAFHVEMSKIVDGEVQLMAEPLACRFEPVRQQLICPVQSSQWQFRWDGDKLFGALIVDGAAFRFIQVDKAAH